MLAISPIVLILGPLAVSASSLFDSLISVPGLSPRQSPTIPLVPAQCKQVCDPINTVIANTCTIEKCCTDGFVRGWFSCVLCVGKALNLTSSEYSKFQSTLNDVHDECAKRGFDTPVLTFPGQGPSSSVAGSPPVPSSSSRASSAAPLPSSAGSAPPPPFTLPPITQQTITTPVSPTSSAASDGTTTTTPSSSSQVKASWLMLIATTLGIFGLQM